MAGRVVCLNRLCHRDGNTSVACTLSKLDGWHEASEHMVHRIGNVRIDRETVFVLYLDEYVECWRGFPFEHCLLRASSASFLIRQSDRLNAADQVRQGRVNHQVLERVSVYRCDELHTALGDRARCQGLL